MGRFYCLIVFGQFWLQLSLVNSFPLLERCEILELSYSVSNSTPRFPLHKAFRFTDHHRGSFGPPDKNWFYQMNAFEMGEHVGTHIDAPIHYGGSAAVDHVPFMNLIGEACVVNVENQTSSSSVYEVSVDDLKSWEEQNGRFSSDCILLIASGWDKFAYDTEAYIGSSSGTDISLLKYPTISGEAAHWLVENRQLKAIGIDTVSPDSPRSPTQDVHRLYLTQRNLPLFENLKNLVKLPPRGATIVALPTNIVDGTGAPVRAFAIGWNGQKDSCKRNTAAPHIGRNSYSFQLILSITVCFCVFGTVYFSREL